jgi:hypothetical protein
LRHGNLCKFVRWSGDTPDGTRQPNATDGARVNNTLAAGFAGDFDDVAGALDICGIHRFVIAQPQMIARRGVKTPITAFDFASQQFTVTHVAHHSLELQTGESGQIAAGSQQRLHPMAAREKLMNKVRANKAGSACNKAIHGLEEGCGDYATVRREIPQQFSRLPLDLKQLLLKIVRVICRSKAMPGKS